MEHPTDCTCPDCDPDTHNDDAAIAAHEARHSGESKEWEPTYWLYRQEEEDTLF